MCIMCHQRDKTGFYFRYYIGGWRNFLYKKHRGEGNPAPWICLILGRFGFEFEADLRWFSWKRLEVFRSPLSPVVGLGIGNFILSWRN